MWTSLWRLRKLDWKPEIFFYSWHHQTLLSPQGALVIWMLKKIKTINPYEHGLWTTTVHHWRQMSSRKRKCLLAWFRVTAFHIIRTNSSHLHIISPRKCLCVKVRYIICFAPFCILQLCLLYCLKLYNHKVWGSSCPLVRVSSTKTPSGSLVAFQPPLLMLRTEVRSHSMHARLCRREFWWR